MPDEQPTFRLRVSRAYEELATPVEGDRREPVVDADVPCPRCGSREWLVIERRAEPHQPFTRWRAVACANCGAADGWGSAGRARPGRSADRRDEWDEDRVPGIPEHPTIADVCRLAPFRILAPSATPELRSHSHAAGKLTGVTVASRGVEVTTEIRHQVLHSLPVDFPPEFRARHRLQHLIDDSHVVLRAPRSEAARELHLAAAGRRAEARAAAARAREAIIDVDGASVPFALVEYERAWAAVADVGDESITIAARRVPAARVALQAVLCD